MTSDDIETLISQFAELQPSGWHIPAWLDELAKRNGVDANLPTFHVMNFFDSKVTS